VVEGSVQTGAPVFLNTYRKENLMRRGFGGDGRRYVTANPSSGNQKIKLNDTEYALNGFKLNGFTTTVALGFSF
jgi:hypothetical protein